MEEILRVENSVDDLSIQYDIISPDADSFEVDRELDDLQNELDRINTEIDRYTNHSDWIDNTIAVSSGVLCGLIDSLFIEELSIDEANEWGTEKTNGFVIWVARKQGYKGNDLQGAVRFLENSFPIAADKATNYFGGGKQHHLRDFSHHPTPVGLFFSLLTQFTKKVYGTNVAGKFDFYELQKEELNLVGKNFHERITYGVIHWFFHMVSDMAGSYGSIVQGKSGTGLPGPLASLLKELSSLPIFRKMNKKEYKQFSVWVSKLFNGTLLGDHDENGNIVNERRFDLRTEIGLFYQLTKQAIPIIINECVVRGLYFIRRFAIEAKNVSSIKELEDIKWKNTLPKKNRTIIRMLTISSGVFMSIDMADAAIRAVGSYEGSTAKLLYRFIVRVNFVGVGRFAIAVGYDVGMGIKKEKLEKQRSSIKSQMAYYKEAKVYYSISGSLHKAMDVETALVGLEKTLIDTEKRYSTFISDMNEDSKRIIDSTEGFVKNNKDTVDELNRLLSEV